MRKPQKRKPPVPVLDTNNEPVVVEQPPEELDPDEDTSLDDDPFTVDDYVREP